VPIKSGKSQKTISSNIGEIIKSWKESGKIGTSSPKSLKEARAQAAAISYAKARSAGAKIPKQRGVGEARKRVLRKKYKKW